MSDSDFYLDDSTANIQNVRCKNNQIANLFPARAVAIGCLYLVMEDRNLETIRHKKDWLAGITSRKVDVQDFDEVIDVLRRTST